ncbi:MAG: hypothetical protein RBG13Loki_2891 [Promethearchaeota archaeon CR_4]|nr:MAG: hypothetical protein RBG13Loki_2891 [Candidatus Lokiarchaeota archaeon CR_4]
MPPQVRKAAKRTKRVGSTRLQVEAEIFAQAKTLERLQAGFEGGEFDDGVYRRQLSVSLQDLFQLQKKYEDKGHSFKKFIEAQTNLGDLRKILGKIENLHQSFTGQGGITLASLQQLTYKQFAATASDLTASFITLLDCIKLRGVAKPALLLEFLTDTISHATKMTLDPQYISRLEELQGELKQKTEDLSEQDLDLLEHQVDVFFTEFQLDLKKDQCVVPATTSPPIQDQVVIPLTKTPPKPKQSVVPATKPRPKYKTKTGS